MSAKAHFYKLRKILPTENMYALGIRIVIFIATGISLIMGLYMLFLYNNAKSVKGPGYWAAGNLLVGLGFFLRLIHPDSGFIAEAGSLDLISVGLYIYLAGIWSFKEREIKKWLLIIFPVFDAIQSFVFYFLIPDTRIRVSLHMGIVLIFTVVSIYEMLKLDQRKRYLRKIFRLNALSFAIFLLVIVASLAVIAIYPNHIDREYAWIIGYGICGAIITAVTFGFLSAVNLQLYWELDEQLKTKSNFFSIITHDLRTPVGTLMGFVDLLNNKKDLGEDQKVIAMDNLEILSRSTFHLLQNLLDWANSSGDTAAFEEELFDLNELIISNIKFFQSLTLLKSIRLDFEYDDEVYIMGNPKMIETVIRNLVSNAIKFTPAEGRITIILRKDGKGVHLTVADTGVGIEPERLEHLFSLDKVRTTNGTNGESGSGLGLTLCKDFVTKNRGSIRVESKVKEGTKVIIDFPLAKEGAERS